MPRKPVQNLPVKYEAGFLNELDKRSAVSKVLNRWYDEIVTDLGGEEVLSKIKRTLIERYVFLAACLQTWEGQIAANPKGTQKMLGRWIQGCNSLQGIAKTLGLKMVKPKQLTLEGYVRKKQRDEDD